MMHYLRRIIGIITIVLISHYSFSQVTTTTPVSPTQGVQVLLGSATAPSNVQFLGNAQQIASFTTTGTNLPIGAGLVMSTGNANNAMLNGSAANFLSSDVGGVDGNPLLNSASGFSTYDGAILRFDFSPVGDTMKFNYVFGSEEYNDFTNGTVNDVFGFFLSGPNPLGGNYVDFNVALIPGTALPVSINNVNNGTSGGCASGPCEYCQYFVDNLCGASTIAPDGFTTLLQAIAPVVPCQNYTIKLGIADGGDGIYDSWVFLQENSFSTGAVVISPNYNFSSSLNDTLIYEGCSDVTLDFVKDGVSGSADTIMVAISGTATNGVDYTSAGGSIPTQIIFAPGQTVVQLSLTPEADGLAEGPETVTLTVTNVTPCGDTLVSSVTFVITDVQPMNIDAGPDVLLCPGIPHTFTPVITGGVPPYQQTYWFLNTPGNIVGTSLNNYVPTTGGQYIYTATNGCDVTETVFDTVLVTIEPPQFSLIFDVDSVSCFDTNDGAINMNIIGQTPPFTYYWTPGNTPTEDLTNLGAGNYTIVVTDAFGCQVDSTITVFEPADIPFNITDKFVCAGDSVIINPNPIAGVTYFWTPAAFFTPSVGSSPLFSAPNAGPSVTNIAVSVIATADGACGQDSFTVYVSPLPSVELGFAGLDTTSLCPNDSIPLSNSASQVGFPPITGHLWNTGATTPNIVAKVPTLYWLEVTNNAGCKSRDSLEIVPVSPPNAYIDSVRYICGVETIPLFASSYASTDDLLWSTGATTDTITVNAPGIYTLVISNDCGSDTVSTEVVLIPPVNTGLMPNIVTPNGDNVNDVYTVGDLFYYSTLFNVQVFNRWGAKVYDSDDKMIGWNPKNLSDGVYYMAILYTDCNNEQKKLSHSVTIISK